LDPGTFIKSGEGYCPSSAGHYGPLDFLVYEMRLFELLMILAGKRPFEIIRALELDDMSYAHYKRKQP
jgi:hypothetical protein